MEKEVKRKVKNYNTILSRIRTLLKNYSIDYVKGYIYGLLDWRVINVDTHVKLDEFINKYEIISPLIKK